MSRDHLDSWFTPETKERHSWFIILFVMGIIAFAVYSIIQAVGALF